MTAPDTMLAESVARRLRMPAYAILFAATVLPLVDLAPGLWPLHFGTASWRFGALGVVAGGALASSVGVLLLFAVSVLCNDRKVTFTVAVISAIISVFLAVSAVTFVLDGLQTRGQITADTVHRFDFAVAIGVLKLVFSCISYGFLGFWGLRAARRSPAKGPVSSVLVGRAPSKSAAPMVVA